jgi:hypothetical protein
MKGKVKRSVRKNLVYMEQESMEEVFQQGPDEISEEETRHELGPGVKGYIGDMGEWESRMLKESR